MKTRTRELAKVGIFGSLDNPIIVNEKDLQEIAETFPDQKTAPVKLGGHWSEDRPRLAQVTSVSYDPATKTLSGTIDEQDALAQAVDGGFYPDVSIGAKQRASDGKMYLHHLAYLGDEPPAVKDLENNLDKKLSESETEPGGKKVAASDTDKNIRVFPGTGDKRLYLSDQPVVTAGKAPVPGTPPVPGTAAAPDTKSEQEESVMDEKDVKALQDENARLKADAAAKDKLLSDSFSAKNETEKAALKKAAAGKLPEPEMNKLIALADSFDSGKVLELSDGDAKRTVSPMAVLAEIFDKMPLPVEPGELNLSDPAAPSPASAAKPGLAKTMMANI
jgi:hypothetical protein